MTDNLLQYNPPPASTPPGERVYWVVVAAAVCSAMTLTSLATNLLIYFMPRGYFSGLGTSLRGRTGSATDWGAMTLTIVLGAVHLGMLLAAVAYLLRYPARRLLVISAWAWLIGQAVSLAFFHLRYRESSGMPELLIRVIWDISNFVSSGLMPALVILIFRGRDLPEASEGITTAS
jgi:hypothetical protein